MTVRKPTNPKRRASIPNWMKAAHQDYIENLGLPLDSKHWETACQEWEEMESDIQSMHDSRISFLLLRCAIANHVQMQAINRSLKTLVEILAHDEGDEGDDYEGDGDEGDELIGDADHPYDSQDDDEGDEGDDEGADEGDDEEGIQPDQIETAEGDVLVPDRGRDSKGRFKRGKRS